jgi:predicted DNA-binding protein
MIATVPKTSSSQAVVRIRKELDDRLTRIAARTGRAKAYYASKALERYLEDMEDHLLAAAALEEMKAKGKKRGRSLDAVAKRLGLEGEF